MKNIEIYNARLHNLRNITTTIPKNKFIVVTGVSGSGKSSFVFDILHNEGRKLYLEALGMYNEIFDYNAFDMIQGLSPTITVQQRTINNVNPRSVVGTVTSILNLLAIIYANEGQISADLAHKWSNKDLLPGMFMFNSPHGACSECNGSGTITELNFNKILPSVNETIETWHNFAYCYPNKKKEEKEYISKRLSNFIDYYNCSYDTKFSQLSEEARATFLDYRPKRMQNKKQLIFYGIKTVLEERLKKINKKLPDIQVTQICPKCHGYRISNIAFSVTLNGKHIGQLCKMSILELADFLKNYESSMVKASFTRNIIKEIIKKLNCLELVGLSYLNLYREIPTLSGGEIQRLHIMSHLSAKIDSIIYIFDEPTAGLHELEKEKLIDSFKSLREQGNTVIVVEHDENIIKNSDYIIDFGPMAGKYGGNIIYQGDFENFKNCSESLTAKYLFHKSKPVKSYTGYSGAASHKLSIKNARTNNLKNISVDIPLNLIVGFCGVSGSGKSSLVIDTLLPKLQSLFKDKTNVKNLLVDSESINEDEYDPGSRLVQSDVELDGEKYLDSFFVVTQKLASRHENSCVATFLGIWDNIRKIFAALEDAKSNQFVDGHFSFNSAGSCPICNGNGFVRRWLSGLYFSDQCPSCNGKRFKKEVLKILYKGKNISDVLNMSVSEALVFFDGYKNIQKMLYTIDDMGMGYILLGQSLTTLSGGEAQRLKLARELGKNRKGRHLYILDEPTVGLSYYDTEKLLTIFNKLVSNGHSILLIEHDPYVLSYCDYLIELGPGGGDKGGEVIATGTPEDLKNNSRSIIGKFLE